MMRQCNLLLAGSLAIACVSVAHGDTLNVDLAGAGATMKIGGSTSPIQGSVTAGLMSLEYNSGTGLGANSLNFVQDTTPSGTIAAFCIDLFEYIYSTNNQYDIIALEDAPNYGAPNSSLPAMGSAKAEDIGKIWAEFINNDGGVTVDDPVNGSELNSGFQLAVWEIVYETSGTLKLDNTGGTGGTFYATLPAAAVAKADAILAWLQSSASTNAPVANLKALSAPSGDATIKRQDLIVGLTGPVNIEFVPEPGTLSLATMMLAISLGFGLRKRRNR